MLRRVCLKLPSGKIPNEYAMRLRNTILKPAIVLFAFLLSTGFCGQNETDSVTTDTGIKVGKLYFSPLPVIASNPAFGAGAFYLNLNETF